MAILKIKKQDGSWAVVGEPSAIKFTEQNLTDEQKEQARLNIGAKAEVEEFIELEIDDLNDFVYSASANVWAWNRDPLKSYKIKVQGNPALLPDLETDAYGHACKVYNGDILRGELLNANDGFGCYIKQTLYNGQLGEEHYRYWDGEAQSWTKWTKTLDHPVNVITSNTTATPWNDNTIDKVMVFSEQTYSGVYSGVGSAVVNPDDLVNYYGDKHYVSYDKETSLTDEQKTQARENIGAASESSLSNYVPYKAVIQNTNPFGGKQLYINSIDNAFAAIDKKFYVQITYHKRFDDNGVEYPHIKEGAVKTDADYWVDGPITSTSGFNKNNNDLFNGNYEGGLRISTNRYAKIHIRFSNEEGWTPSTGKAVNSVYGPYPYGTFYISYYYQNHPDLNKRSQYRCYNNGSAHGYGWKKRDFTIFNQSSNGITNIIEACSDEGNNMRTCMEFLIFSDDTTQAGPVELEWKMTRPSFASNTPLLTNYGSNIVYWPMYFRQKMQGVNQVAITPEGTITATSYIKAPVFKGAMEGKLILGDKTYDGSSTITIPVNNFVEKTELDNYLLKTGGTIEGNLSITGDLTIQGNTYTQDNETLRIADNIIEINSNKTDNTTVLSGIAINKNSASTYGIMYDPTNDTVKFGEGATNAGVFSFNEGEGAPLAIRDDSENIDDGAIMIFDKSKNKLVNSGYTINTFKQWVRDYVESYMSTTTTVDADGGEIIEMTVADKLISEKDGILEIGG